MPSSPQSTGISSPRVAVVTGGAGALGSAIVRLMLDSGMRVAVPVHGSSPAGTRETDRRFDFAADLTQEADVGSFVAAVAERWGGVDILVNAAGGYRGGKPVEEVSLDDLQSQLTLNLVTTFLMSRAVVPLMRRRGFGRIINVAAMTALRPAAGKGPYAISKRGVITLTETMAEELRGTGLTVNAVAPSVIRTEANREWMSPGEEAKAVPPEEIAALVLFLCSPAAGGINGNTIRIPGGMEA